MANLPVLDGSGAPVFMKTTGTGTNIDPYVPDNTLPAGAATNALQTTGNTSLASIDAGIPAALGQQPAASSMPVVLANEQVSAGGGVWVGGGSAHSAGVVGYPVPMGGVVQTVRDTTLAAGDVCYLLMTTGQQLVIKPFSPSESDWQVTGSTFDAAQHIIKAAAGAGLRNYITGVQIWNYSTTVGTLVGIKDTGSDLWYCFVPLIGSSTPAVPVIVSFSTPLKGAVNMNTVIQASTTGASIIYSIQGYVAP